MKRKEDTDKEVGSKKMSESTRYRENKFNSGEGKDLFLKRVEEGKQNVR